MGGPPTRLDLGDLPGEGALGERLAATGAGVVERAGADDPHAEGEGVLERQVPLGHLAHRVRGRGAQGCLLVDRQVPGIDHPVLFRASHHQDARRERPPAHRLEEVQEPEDVDAERARGVVPRGLGARLRGQVDDPVRMDEIEGGVHGRRVLEVRLDHGDAPRKPNARAPVGLHDAEDLHARMLGAQELGHVAPDEARDSGDEDLHRNPPTPDGPFPGPPCWSPRKLPMEPMLASSTLNRHCRSSRPL